MKPFWFPAGDSALLLDFQGFKPVKKNYFLKNEEKIYYSKKVSLISSHLQSLLNKNKLYRITEIVPGIASILIHYNLSLVSYDDVKNKIQSLRAITIYHIYINTTILYYIIYKHLYLPPLPLPPLLPLPLLLRLLLFITTTTTALIPLPLVRPLLLLLLLLMVLTQ